MRSWTSKATLVSNRDCLRKAVKRSRRPSTRPIRIPVTLHPTQQEFFDDDRLELFLGGAAGGGKTVAQLASALKYAHVPGYSAILFRRSYSHLSMPGAFIPLAREWLRGTKATYNQADYVWRFESGATLSFGYLDHDRHLDRYQSAAFQYIGIDEATQIPEHHYRYLFSRLRKPEGFDVPLRRVLRPAPRVRFLFFPRSKYASKNAWPDTSP